VIVTKRSDEWYPTTKWKVVAFPIR